MARPIIALLTDFGTRDHYVGSMKGAILAICQDAAIVDITHDVPVHDVRAGGSALAASFLDFPQETVFVAVVDPGVGSTRRALAAQAGPYRFVGPDNGILSAVFARATPEQIVELTRGSYARPEISRTFEGRDRFAPAAAWIARGVPMERLGPPIEAATIMRLDLKAPRVTAQEIDGEVERTDRFGNLITNVDRHVFDAFSAGRTMTVRVGGHTVPFVATYADVPPGSLCSLFGSTHQLEIAANTANAAALLGVSVGARVVIFPARD